MRRGEASSGRLWFGESRASRRGWRTGNLGRFVCIVLLGVEGWMGEGPGMLLGAEQSPAAQEAGSASAKASKSPAPEVRFIRVYAPADRIGQWPWGEMKYVPVERAEFEQLIQGLEEADSRRPSPGGIQKARYIARFSEPAFLEGEATFQLHHAASSPAVFRWPKQRLAVRNAAWLDGEGKPAEPALLGLSETGQTELVVARSGQLRLEWSFQGERESSGAARFDLGLPPCPHTELRLDLPDNFSPALEGALIRLEESASGPGRKSWLLEWGGQTPGALRLAPQQAGGGPSAVLLVQQETQYRLSPEGLEGVVRFGVQTLADPVSELSLLIDPGLEVVRVKLGEQEAPWTIYQSGQAGQRRIMVRPPQPIRKEGQLLQVEVVGAAPLETAWQTPRLRMEGAVWQQGVWGVRIVSPLEAQRLVPIGCQQSKTESHGPSETNPLEEYFEFQGYSPEAAVELTLARKTPQLQADVGSVVMFTERQMSCRVRARFRADAGEHFLLEAQVGRRWLIDAVEADPSTQVEDWSLEPAAAGGQRLTIRLTRPITPQRPVTLLITGRRLQSPVGRTWRTEDLVPLRFAGRREGKRLTALCSPEASYELICLTPEPTLWLNPRQLDPADWELVDKTTEGFLFFDAPQAESLQWVLRSRPPQYRAKIHLDVLASERSLWERYRIECIPEGSRVERVVIVFSHARPEPVRWTVGGDSERQWTARRLTEKELPTALAPPGGEAWEIMLRPSRSGAFEIVGQRSSALAAETPISLVGLPQATAQEAVVRLRTVGPEGPQIFSQRIQPIPTVSEDFIPGWTTQLAAFRYAPQQELAGTMPPALRLRLRQESAVGRETWVWQARLESRFQPDGQADHRAVYWLVNFHRTQLTFHIPSDPESTQIQGVWLNGEPARRSIVNSSPDASGVSVVVELAPVRTFSVLVVGFRTQGPPLRRIGRVRPIFPQPDAPVNSRSWTVWLPPGFEALSAAGEERAGLAGTISVRERLFGVWARPAHRQPFDPMDSDHWKNVYAADPQLRQSQEQAEAFFQTLGTLLAQPPAKPVSTDSSKPVSAGRRWTWGELLQQEALNRVGKIVIDRQGLWEAGIDPASAAVISSPPAQGAEQRAGREALWQAGLALGVRPGLILITSGERAARHPTLIQSTGDPLVWYLPGGGLARQMEQAAASRMDPALLPASMWQESAEPSPAGVLRPLEWVPQNSLLGWSAYRIEVAEESLANGQLQIEVLDRDQFQAWYWSAFLVAVGAGVLLVRRSPSVVLAAAGLLGAGALAASEPLAPVSGGAFCGMLLCLAGWAVYGTSRSVSVESLPAGASPGPSPSTSRLAIKTGILLALSLFWTPKILGAEQPASGSLSSGVSPPSATIAPQKKEQPASGSFSSGAAPLYRVFIPIDEKEQPTGDPYQVPEPFYQYLRRRAPSLLPTASRQRLRQATYRGQLSWNPAASRWEIPRLSVVWQWDIVGKASPVRLAISRENFIPIPGTWLVEGQPIEPQWNEEEKRFFLPAPTGVSSVRIEGQVRPVLLSQGGFQGMDLSIPPAMDARLELALPPEGPEIRVPGAFGMVKRLADPSPRLIAELGPTEQLSVRWPLGSSASTPPTLPEVEQLLWLHVEPGAVLLDARFRVQLPTPSAGGYRFRVMGEGRWRLLSWEVEGGGNMEITPAPGGQVLEFSLPALGPDRLGRASARFLLTDAAGVGAVRLGKLEPLEARVQKRWLAVSVDSSLDYPEPSPNRPHAAAVEEFLNLWGPADTPPRFVENLAALGTAWSLVCRPRLPNTSAEQTLSLGCGEKGVRVFYEARLTTTSGFSFQHRLQTPPDLEVESITIQQDNTSRPVRWARTADGKLTVFSYTPLSGRYELRLSGGLPNQLSQRRPVPYIEIEGVETEWATLELFRQPEVVVRLSKSDGLTEMESPPSDAKSSLGRPLKSFAVDPRQIAGAEIQVLPNRPQWQLRQITLVRPDIEQWQAEVDLLLHVQRGLLDEILLEVPSSWPGPYKTTSPVALSMKELGEGRRAVVVRPPAPIEGTYRIRLAGPILWPKTGPQEPPKILPLNVSESEHLLILPTQWRRQPLVWETQGLEKTELPETAASEWIGQEAWQAYRVIAAQFTARVRPAADQPQRPEVRLADFHLRWETDGACSGKVWFYLLPAGQDRCTVCLPKGFRLLHVQVEQNPTPLLLDQQAERCTVLLGSSELPQVVQASFRGVLSPEVWQGRRPFPGPWIENWPPAVSLWTIYPPAGYELAEPEGGGRVNPLRLDAYRLRTTGELMEIGFRQMGEKEDFLRWYQVWRGRFSAMLGQVQRQLALPPPTELHRTVRAEAQSWQLKLAQWAETLGFADSPAGNSSTSLASADAAKLWLGWLEGTGSACRGVLHGGAERFLLTFSPEKTTGIFLRWLLAAGLAGCLAGLGWAVRKPSIRSSLARGAPVWGVLAGGFWWLWLWPSVLGWILMLLSLLGAGWKRFAWGRASQGL